jgi:transposase
MESMYYIGLDVHKKTISYCVEDASGRIHAEGKIPARRFDLDQWVQLKNKISGLWLMEVGVSDNKEKLHKVGYFRELLATNPDINEGLKPLLRLCRETVVRLQKTEGALIRSLERDPVLAERVKHLMTIPAVGPITALTWALEVGEVRRFSSIKNAISYCGLCGAEDSSGDHSKRTPISKQRNKHLQWVPVEAAHMAPRLSPELAMLNDREKQKGNTNRATLVVAGKLVAYLVAIDRRQQDFLLVKKENQAAA